MDADRLRETDEKIKAILYDMFSDTPDDADMVMRMSAKRMTLALFDNRDVPAWELFGAVAHACAVIMVYGDRELDVDPTITLGAITSLAITQYRSMGGDIE